MENSDLPTRKKNRYPGYDYSHCGAYHITICANEKRYLFGKIITDDKPVYFRTATMVPNKTGKMIAEIWNDIPNHYDNVIIENFVVMPNHFHGIITLTDDDHGEYSKNRVQNIISAFKSLTARQYKKITGKDEPLWQKGFYDSILDNEKKYWNAYNYIIDNPQNWIAGKDEYFVD